MGSPGLVASADGAGAAHRTLESTARNGPKPAAPAIEAAESEGIATTTTALP
jgi:hypothetical protein